MTAELDTAGRPERILIIDDADAIRCLVQDALGLAGFTVLEAAGVASGLQAIKTHQPDLILCDVMLGDGTGYEVLSALQADTELASIPIILISGEEIGPGDIRRGMARGADDYLLKPFGVRELIESVDARLQRSRRLAQPQRPLLPSCFAGSYEHLCRLQQSLGEANEPFCLLAIGLHRFERFLRLFGWQQAEQLTQRLVERLLGQLEGLIPAAYHSYESDKFYLLWRGDMPSTTAAGLAQRVLRCLEQPLEWQEHVLRLSAQVGVVLGASAEAADKADLALLQATERGSGSVVFFEADYEQALRSHLQWEETLHAALEQGWFELHYQPQFELAGLRLCGVEALLRLRHPKLGMVSPAVFIPIAEDCGLMERIGSWVLTAACHQAANWWHSDGMLLRMAVNVSQIQFQRQDFAGLVEGVLQQTGLPARALELELTESMLMQQPALVLKQLEKLKQLGLSLAMDDFGTGYSSLSLLGRMPFDLLKIDQSFVFGLGAEAASQAIPRAITEMGHSLGMRILAEGIERTEHLQLLQEMGCDLGQGFHLGRPKPAEDLRQLWRG